MKILVYDDNTDYGGHQAMACHGIEALAEVPEVQVTCMINPANHRLAERLKSFPILNTPCRDGQIDRLNPDIVLAIQGSIDQSAKGVTAAHQAGIECVSYLAIPHTLRQMGAKLGALRDRFSGRSLNLPDRYIVISESMRQILLHRGTTAPIDVVPNGIQPPPSNLKPETSNLTTIGLLGRIEFHQKRQDFMVNAYLHHPETFAKCRLLIAGSGPDEKRLARMIKGRKNIEFQPWKDDTEAFYKAIDILVIPSRYEGMPLVMFEALARGIPVIGSCCDGMRDTLPRDWTFEPGNDKSLADTFKNMQDNWRNEIDTLQEKILAEASLNIFKTRFCAAVTGRC